jgi:hypothetical protein
MVGWEKLTERRTPYPATGAAIVATPSMQRLHRLILDTGEHLPLPGPKPWKKPWEK